jgi:divalent metal cation (Fe/Co/Zn/Cd) transporter
VLWRYSLKSNTIKKDKNALTKISALFILSSLFILIESITNIVIGVPSLPNYLFVIMSVIQVFLFFLMGTYKYHLATLLNNNTVLITDCIVCLTNSGYVLLFSVSMIFNFYSNVWYLSSIFGILIGVFQLAYGVYLLFKIFYWKEMDILIEGFVP